MTNSRSRFSFTEQSSKCIPVTCKWVTRVILKVNFESDFTSLERQRRGCSAKQGEKPYAYVHIPHKPQLSPLFDRASSVDEFHVQFFFWIVLNFVHSNSLLVARLQTKPHTKSPYFCFTKYLLRSQSI